MYIRGLTDEDFVNYKKPCMFICACYCDWKCCKEQGLPVETCQNSGLEKSKIINISADEIFRRYISNPITEAVVIGGLEPFLQAKEVGDLIAYFRKHHCNDTFIIYTGYEPDEIQEECEYLKNNFNNIIIKFGRYITGQQSHYDEVLGVRLASGNQRGVVLC